MNFSVFRIPELIEMLKSVGPVGVVGNALTINENRERSGQTLCKR